MILSCKYHQDLGDFESVVAKKLNSAMNKKEKKEMKNKSDIRDEVIREIKAWVNSRFYPCLVDFENFTAGTCDITLTRVFFLPCGIIDIRWDEVESADETIAAILGHVTKLHKEYHERVQQNRDRAVPAIEKVIFNNPATIIFWKDGTKTVVKCSENDEFNPEVGMAMAISKKALGKSDKHCNDFKREFKKWVEPYYEEISNYDLQSQINEYVKAAEKVFDNLSYRRSTIFPIAEENESLKGAEIGKAIGEGFKAGIKDVSEPKEKTCATCYYRYRISTSRPCCDCDSDYDKWKPEEDVNE